MNSSLLSILVDPVLRKPLQMSSSESKKESVVSGSLRAEDGKVYLISNGIPRFVEQSDRGQQETTSAFQYLWKEREGFSSQIAQDSYAEWLVENYGFSSATDQADYFASRKRILDLGCGRGYASSPWLLAPERNRHSMWVGIDISEAVDVAKRNLEIIANTHFVQGDALALPFPDGCFDTIISQGVMHHTPSTRSALLSASRVLGQGGEIHFYVYRLKGPVREFSDDYIREQIAPLSDEEAWEAMRSLTQLGRVLWETGAKVELQSDIPLLGIKAGKYDVQRVVYWNFAKLYWNEKLSFDDNVHVNFDWYRPRYAHRQTAEEVQQWCNEANLSVKWFHEQESGFSVRALKK